VDRPAQRVVAELHVPDVALAEGVRRVVEAHLVGLAQPVGGRRLGDELPARPDLVKRDAVLVDRLLAGGRGRARAVATACPTPATPVTTYGSSWRSLPGVLRSPDWPEYFFFARGVMAMRRFT
jgi:hypothetical protein